MLLINKLRLLWTFYGNYSLASNLLNLALAYAYFNAGPQGFSIIVAFKLATLGLIVMLIHGLRKNQYYYYRNIGMRWEWLWGASLAFDLLVFSLFLFIAKQLQ